jgi:hypothetical protein
VNDDDERGIPGEALNIDFISYSDHGRYGDLPLQGKTPTTEPEIEPGSSCLVVRSSDHQATRLIILRRYSISKSNTFSSMRT